jgi:hypothetical protein
MQVLISKKTATFKCRHQNGQPLVDRNRCAAGTTSILDCAVLSAAAADDYPANMPLAA